MTFLIHSNVLALYQDLSCCIMIDTPPPRRKTGLGGKENPPLYKISGSALMIFQNALHDTNYPFQAFRNFFYLKKIYTCKMSNIP